MARCRPMHVLDASLEQSGDAAIAACDRAIASNRHAGPELAELYSNRCAEFLVKSSNDRALADCNEAVRINPNSGLARLNRARSQLARNATAEAFVEHADGLADAGGVAEKNLQPPARIAGFVGFDLSK